MVDEEKEEKEKKDVKEEEEVEENEESAEGGGDDKKAKAGGRGLGPGVFKILKIVGMALGLITITVVVAYVVATMKTKDLQAPGPRTFDDELQAKPPLLPWTMGEMIINTADVEETHIIKVDIVFGYSPEDNRTMTDLNSRKFQLRDVTRGIIGSKKFSDVNTTFKQDLLKKEILKKINPVLSPGCKVDDVWFNDLSVH